MKTPSKSLILGFVSAAFLAPAAHAATMVTIAEDPGDYNSSLLNTSVYNFDSINIGLNRNVNWKGVGTFDQLNILKANQYGGAPTDSFPKGSPYSVQGVGSPVKQTVLTLDTPSSYFGVFWSAGDAANRMSFYNGTEIVAEFTTANLMNLLPKEYYGNPLDRRMNPGEPYGFINFYGDSSTSWDRVVFSNTSTSGFESDNYTSREQAWSAKEDGAIAGRPVALVEGTKVSKLDVLPDRWQAPAAPIPPVYALIAFAVVAILRGMNLIPAKVGRS